MKKKGIAAVIALMLCMMMVVSTVPVSVLAAQTDGQNQAEEKLEQDNTEPKDIKTDEDSVQKEETVESETKEEEKTVPENEGNGSDVKDESQNTNTEKKEDTLKGKKQTKSDEDLPEEVADNNIPVLSLIIPEDEFTQVLQSTDHSYRAEDAKIKIDVPEGYTGDYSDTALSGTEELDLEYFRGRGNSTWQGEGYKNPFKFKLNDSKNLLKMGKNKHWVLLANDFDESLMRNRLIGYIAKELGMEFSPKFTPVDFVVNGRYYGSYLLCHEIRVGNNRVEIDELTENDNEEPNVTGGYLLSLHPYNDEDPAGVFEMEREMDFLIRSPEFGEGESGTAAQKKYIQDYMQRVEDAVYSEDFKDKTGTPIEELIDFESWAKYWIVQEFANNGDAFVTPSTYLYKKRDKDGKIGKLYFGPLWDFDLAISNYVETDYFNFTEMPWIDELRDRNPEFVSEIQKAWKQMNPVITETAKKGGVLDRYTEEIRNSWEDNNELYHSGEEINLDEAVLNVREALLARQEFFNDNIEEKADRVFCNVSFFAGDNEVAVKQVRCGNRIDNSENFAGKDAEIDGYVLVDWKDSDGVSLDDYDTFEEDTAFYAQYIEQAEAVMSEAIYFPTYDVWADIHSGKTGLYEYTIVPEEAQDTNIWWSSSNDEVAYIDDEDSDDFITLNSVGETVITAKTKSGATAKVTLHVYDSDETEPAEDADIILEKDQLDLNPGDYGQVRLSFEPAPSGSYVMFESSDEDIAEVDTNGVVKGISPGTAVITVTNMMNDRQATYTVVVKDNSEEMKKAREELSDRIVEASKLISTGRYTKGSVEKLKNAIKAANDVLDDPFITMRDINIQKTRLLRAMRLLEPVNLQEEEEKKEYNNAVDALAKTLIDGYKVNSSKYQTKSFKAFSTALKKGSSLLEKEDSTVEELRNARSDILKKWQKLQKKKANRVKVKTKKIKVKQKTLKKKSIAVKKKKVFAVKKGVGKISFKKIKGNKKIRVTANGELIISKGLKKGTYSVKVQVKASGNGDYKKGVKKVKIKVKVK